MRILRELRLTLISKGNVIIVLPNNKLQRKFPKRGMSMLSKNTEYHFWGFFYLENILTIFLLRR